MNRKTQRRLRDIDAPILDLGSHPTETVTPKVMAAHERCDVRTILRMVEQGALVGYRVGREWRISVASARAVFHVQLHRAAS